MTRCGRPDILPQLPAEWQSGHAAACKAVYLGSIPGSASISPAPYSPVLALWFLGPVPESVMHHPRPRARRNPARVAKLVYARDLKSLGFGHAGSIPAPGTKQLQAIPGLFPVAMAHSWHPRRQRSPTDARAISLDDQGYRLRFALVALLSLPGHQGDLERRDAGGLKRRTCRTPPAAEAGASARRGVQARDPARQIGPAGGMAPGRSTVQRAPAET
jgi:hypothetical protein